MKILVIGASGYLGKSIHERLMIENFEVVGTSRAKSDKFFQLNFLNFNEISKLLELVKKDVDVVLLLSAISKPDVCSTDYQNSYEINVTQTSYIIKNVLQMGKKVVFFSSDTVYGQQEMKFDESHTVSPFGEYAHMKNIVEEKFKNYANFKSIRLSYVYSATDEFTKYIRSRTLEKSNIEIYHPLLRSMIAKSDVIEGVISILKKWHEVKNTFINFGGPNCVSRLEYVEALKKVLLPELQFTTSTPSETFLQSRPKIINMTSPILESLLGYKPLDVHQSFVSIEFAREWNGK